ncbi:MAG: SDR family NAD(P)-dependent oxidoreductase [Rubripirellula sp.]
MGAIVLDLGLNDGSVLVTGAAGGIGLEVAKRFAREGCDLILWDQSPQIDEVAGEIANQCSVSVRAYRLDVADENEVNQAARELTDPDSGILKYVVHAAAVGSGCFGFPFTRLNPSDWLKPLQVNLMGMVNLAHAVAPILVKQTMGSFVMIGSVAGQIGSQTDPPYSATKAANINFTQCMAKDLAPHGIRVNMVCPGMVKTDLMHSVWEGWSRLQGEASGMEYDQWVKEKVKAMIPLGNLQTTEDIANMVLFLSSRCASQVTGQIINVDGGYVMHW